jgi:hypothetical protein
VAIRLIESFDHYNDITEFQRKGWSYSDGGDMSINFSGGPRFNGYSIYFSGGGSTSYASISKSLTTNENVLYAGSAHYISTITFAPYFSFADSGTQQVGWRINTNGSVSVIVGGVAGTVLATTPISSVIASTWVHIAIEVTIHSSSGTVKLWINGDLVVDLSSQDTQQSANSYANQVVFGSRLSTGETFYIDDFYSGDDTGSINTSCPTEARVGALYSTSSGTYQEWSYVGTTYAWQAVDDATPDDDTSYIYSSTSGTRATFTFADLEADADSVYAVQFVNYGRKDDADVRATRFLMGMPSGTFYEYGTGSYMGSSYQYFTYIQETDPITGDPLTPTIINDNEVGVIVSI